MAKSVDDRGRGARMASCDEGAYCWYVTEPPRSQPGWIRLEDDRLILSRALPGGFYPACSGTLLTQNLVLTAHRCVAELNSADGARSLAI